MKRYVVQKLDIANYLLEEKNKLIKVDIDKKDINKSKVVYIFEDTDKLRNDIKEWYNIW